MNINKFGYPVTTFTANMPVKGSEHYVFSFDNGYGASVIRGPHTYGGSKGLWEVAVLDSDGDLYYRSPITNDVIGYLSEDEVASALESIAALPAFDMASN